MQISSTDNALYKRLRKLSTTPRACRIQRRTLAEGTHLIESALAAGIGMHTLLLRGEQVSASVRALALEAQGATGASLVVLAPTLYDALAPVEHGVGLLAELEVATPELPQSIRADAVWLDGVQDPGNVGTLLRTASAAGVGHVAAGEGTAALWSPKVMRAAMGAHFALSLYEGVDIESASRAFGATILAADAHSSSSVFEGDWSEAPTLWLFGAEGSGLSAAALSVAHVRLRIPIVDGVESLNVAAAAAVCLFEQLRRRQARRVILGLPIT